MITFRQRGNFNKTTKFLTKAENLNLEQILQKYGDLGVQALASATPVDTGKTADHWSYEVEGGPNESSIVWTNDNTNEGVNIAIILHYGHGTGTGGYVEGRGYITPAIRPIFDQIANAAWKEVTSA